VEYFDMKLNQKGLICYQPEIKCAPTVLLCGAGGPGGGGVRVEAATGNLEGSKNYFLNIDDGDNDDDDNNSNNNNNVCSIVVNCPKRE
jgi:hypothetical protein